MQRRTSLDLTIETDAAPNQQRVDEWRERFPRAVKIRAEYPTDEREARVRVSGRGLDDVYAEYHGTTHGADDRDDMVALFRDVFSEVTR